MVEDPKRMCQLTSLCVPLVLLYTIIYYCTSITMPAAMVTGPACSRPICYSSIFLYQRMTLETCESRETPHLLPISVLLTHPQTDSAIQ